MEIKQEIVDFQEVDYERFPTLVPQSEVKSESVSNNEYTLSHQTAMENIEEVKPIDYSGRTSNSINVKKDEEETNLKIKYELLSEEVDLPTLKSEDGSDFINQPCCNEESQGLGNEMSTPPDIVEKAKNTSLNLLPTKSRERYETVYQKFMDWKLKRKINSFAENVMLTYFEELSKEMKPSSLWTIYSMLRSTININHDNINIATYPKLLALLKRKSGGFKSKKSKTLTSKEINVFLRNAPDSRYLLMKVVLIFGISGACRKQELRNLEPEDVEDTGKCLIIHIANSKTKTQRSFVVSEFFYLICKNYINLRPAGQDVQTLPFFLNFVDGKCTKQCVGINKIGSMPKRVAEYLGLANPKQYTGHCFKRSSASILVDAGGDMLA